MAPIPRQVEGMSAMLAQNYEEKIEVYLLRMASRLQTASESVSAAYPTQKKISDGLPCGRSNKL
ncbi:hypothetical protein Tcan_16104 [Toxocara canis]|uniref:Uncharacterized protein n=1 Tax=Toxocara canis TaxID=6265 RepID=A0A0B2UZK5_TOXCA|nr:hypothetical protein Tcan_16104 [Toxocara canis]